VTDFSSASSYLDALEREIEDRAVTGSGLLTASAVSKPDPVTARKADTVYIGGGTPSVLPPGAITRILNKLRGHFVVTGSDPPTTPEITVEANPESCTHAFLSECVTSGVNRLSLGLQSHDDEILKAIGRPHRYADFLTSVEAAERSGIANISVDLMTGLPGQTSASLAESLRHVTLIPSVKHISLYALTVEEGTPLHRFGYKPDEDLQADMYESSVRFLESAGFFRYEVSNFARPGYESRHNQKYWNGEEYLGFGAGAHSFVETKNEKRKTKDVGGNADSQTAPTEIPSTVHRSPSTFFQRIENHADLARYIAGHYVKSRVKISPGSRAEEMIMLSLRTTYGLDLEKFKTENGRDLLAEKEPQIAELLKLNLIGIDKNRLFVKSGGFYLLNSIILKLI